MDSFNSNKKTGNPRDFNAVTLSLASPERIREWSYGEVTKAETVNYRTQRSERKGLFDEALFGPERDYECYCGKYRRIRYKDIICEKCGVEVTRSIVRRERMAHIELATPVAHAWFLKSIPSKIGLILGITAADLEKVVYFSGYIVTKVNEAEKAKILKEIDSEYKQKVKQIKSDEAKDKLKESMSAVKKEVNGINVWKVLDEVAYHKCSLKYAEVFEAEIGGEAVYNIFRSLDMTAFHKELEEKYEKVSKTERTKLQKRLNIAKQMSLSGTRPEWMFLTVVPVIPPAIRPMVSLDGGRSATSDINDLYRRVINRNNRLKKLMDIHAPEVILRNEKRILQEAVDALIDNSVQKSTGAVSQSQRRPLKSLSDNLKGKNGRFRQNLLGKRVDYSARSVIVVGPTLRLYQCGLPKHMALEIFRPFIIHKLIERELTYSIKGANKLIDEKVPEVWEMLDDVIKDKRVLLNRAPTLHRLGIQAFKPVLIEGNAIQLHPLVCAAYNADFDGDQMAVHLPLSVAAQEEANTVMAAERNVLGVGNNEVITSPSHDMVMGIYWMTNTLASEEKRKDEDIKRFSSPVEASTVYDHRKLGIREYVYVYPGDDSKYQKFKGEAVKTTVGRIIFNRFLPADFRFINKVLTKKDIANIIDELIGTYGIDAMADILDNIKKFGFRYATKSGISLGIDDFKVPEEKGALVEAARKKVSALQGKFDEGYISSGELYRMSIEIWDALSNDVKSVLIKSLDKDGSVYNMMGSGARGNPTQVNRMVGMVGLVMNPSQQIINFPIIPSFIEGVSSIEYFVSTHGARKGLTDTALNTAKAGYLTRKLVYVSDSVIITEKDCGDKIGREIRKEDSEQIHASFASDVRGRYLLEDIKDKDGKVVLKAGTLVRKQEADAIKDSGAQVAKIRSPLACTSIGGMCSKCYGLDMARNVEVEIGEPVGVVAAQAIGEPGTQFTMRTFHTGGAASAGGDITTGLPRVEEIFSRRSPKNPALIIEEDGEVMGIEKTEKEHLITVLRDKEARGKSKDERKIYAIPAIRVPYIKEGDSVKKGQIASDGSVDLGQLFKLAGRVATEAKALADIHEIYATNGASINRKHIEIVVGQMFSRVKVTNPGDGKFSLGEIIEARELYEEKQRVKASKGELPEAEETILGITEVSHTTASFLAAASFENTQKILANTALGGGVDRLRGLKENVLVGRLIPAGTGLKGERDPEEELFG